MINNYSYRQFSSILKQQFASLKKYFGESTNSFRLYDRLLKSFDFTVEKYSNYALVIFYTLLTEEEIQHIVSIVGQILYIPADNVIVKFRLKQEMDNNRNSDDIELQIKESGIIFNVNLTRRMDTGIFLENYRTRLLVKELAGGRDVLNLFCYTGGYTLFAYSGGAKSCISIDTSSYALDTCRKNMESNGFKSDNFSFVKTDAVEYVQNYSGQRVGLIIIDCPAFSNRHSGRERIFSVQKDYLPMINSCKKFLYNDGIILFRTSLSTFELDRSKLRDFKILTYTSEMAVRGFSRHSGISKTFILKKNH